jgi:hypothetical protein
MNWDVVVINYGGKAPPPDEMAGAPPPGPLGLAAQVRSSIAAYLPGVDWSDPNWGIYKGGLNHDGLTRSFSPPCAIRNLGYP